MHVFCQLAVGDYSGRSRLEAPAWNGLNGAPVRLPWSLVSISDGSGMIQVLELLSTM